MQEVVIHPLELYFVSFHLTNYIFNKLLFILKYLLLIFYFSEVGLTCNLLYKKVIIQSAKNLVLKMFLTKNLYQHITTHIFFGINVSIC